MKLAIEVARSAGAPVAVHASTAEGRRRATLAGAETIEHGDDGTPVVFKLVDERRVARAARRLPQATLTASTRAGRRDVILSRSASPGSAPHSARRSTPASRF